MWNFIIICFCLAERVKKVNKGNKFTFPFALFEQFTLADCLSLFQYCFTFNCLIKFFDFIKEHFLQFIHLHPLSFSDSDGSGSKVNSFLLGWGQPSLVWVWKVSPRNPKFFHFFLLGKKNFFWTGKKVPWSKTGRPHFYCGSKVCSSNPSLCFNTVDQIHKIWHFYTNS